MLRIYGRALYLFLFLPFLLFIVCCSADFVPPLTRKTCHLYTINYTIATNLTQKTTGILVTKSEVLTFTSFIRINKNNKMNMIKTYFMFLYIKNKNTKTCSRKTYQIIKTRHISCNFKIVWNIII